MRSLEGMSIIVTGGGSGIGEGTARHFAARGARVTISGRRPEQVTAVAKEIGDGCLAVPGDVTVDADRRRLVDAAVGFGGGLHALINNAGNMYRAPVTELDEAELLRVFNTNVIGGMLLTGLCVPHLAASGGAVVFIGSIHTQRAFPGASPYAATKGALEALAGALAAELGPQGIRVNCVRPGAVFTQINQRAGLMDDETARARLDAMGPSHPLGRIGTATEIAEALEYLVCAEWTTGTVFSVDGGLGLGATNA
jgi:NAD(P)-dependent dehydrogenase (short-subunit alcohol dehydrogenase family)